MQLNPAEISELIKSRIQGLSSEADIRNQGTVVSVTDGIVRVHGLSDVMQGEMLEFTATAAGVATYGLALNLERDSVGAVILGEYEHISEGDTRGRSSELKHLTLHHVRQTVHAHDTVSDRHHSALVANVCIRRQTLNSALDQLRNFCWIELHDSFLLSLNRSGLSLP